MVFSQLHFSAIGSRWVREEQVELRVTYVDETKLLMQPFLESLLETQEEVLNA